MTTGLFLLLNIGTSEMMLILFVALFLFGGKKLPELARGLGRGIREFKDASETIKRDISDQINNFEDDIENVKSDIKSITQDSVVETDTLEETIKETTSDPKPANLDHQHDISHSDQYYKNYDYNYPDDPVENIPTTDVDQTTTDIAEESSVSNPAEEVTTTDEQITTDITTNMDENVIAKDADETGSANS